MNRGSVGIQYSSPLGGSAGQSIPAGINRPCQANLPVKPGCFECRLLSRPGHLSKSHDLYMSRITYPKRIVHRSLQHIGASQVHHCIDSVLSLCQRRKVESLVLGRAACSPCDINCQGFKISQTRDSREQIAESLGFDWAPLGFDVRYLGSPVQSGVGRTRRCRKVLELALTFRPTSF